MANNEVKYARIVPQPSSGLPTFDAMVVEIAPPVIWGGGNEPFPTPPISGIPGLPGYEPPRPLPEPTMGWEYHENGWYFIAGPYNKPQAICPSTDARVGNITKADWKTDGHGGWYFVSGPFDRPIPICGVETPEPPEPPEPPGQNCHWTYTSAGWILCCGPYDKPKPPTP